MATDVSIRLGVDGEKEFKSALSGIDSQIKNLNSEMKTIVSSMSGMDNAEGKVAQQTEVLGRTIEATKQKISTISSEYDKQKQKLQQLGDALDKLQNAQDRDEVAITKAANAYNKQATAVNNLGTKLNNATTDLNRMEQEMRDLESGADKAGDALDDLGDDAQDTGNSLRDAFAGGAIAGGIQSLFDSISGLVDQTTEYRKIMGTLETSSQKAGYSADQTASSYRQLYGVIGDDQQSATALANLQALGVSQEQLTQFIDGSIGAWATYGDSIPIDGLAEAINETAQAGVVTGTFADVLNWAGTSEDEFNEKLAACSTESERANLILQELQDQGLIGAAEAWRENNAAMVESNEAQLAMNDALASIAETLSPLVSTITQGLAAGLQAIQPIIQFLVDNLPALAPILAAIAAGIAAMKISSFVSSLATAVTSLSSIGTVLSGVLSAIGGPATLIVAAIAGIATAIITLWNTNESFREAVMTIWEAIKGFFVNAWTAIQTAWSAALPFFQAIWDGIQTIFSVVATVLGGFFSAAWTAIQTVWSVATGFFSGIWNAIQSVFSVAESVLGGFFSAAWSAIESVWSTVTGFFQNVWSGIQNAFSSVQSFFSNAFESAKNAVQNAWSGITSFFSGIWSDIKGIFSSAFSAFSNIGQNIVNGIRSGISNGWNALTGWVRAKANSLLNAAKSALGINSPSKAFRDAVGTAIPEGIAAGIDKGERYAINAIDSLSKDLTDASAASLAADSLRYGANLVSRSAVASPAVQAVASAPAVGGETYHVEIPFNINAKEFYRATINDLRSVLNASARMSGKVQTI